MIIPSSSGEAIVPKMTLSSIYGPFYKMATFTLMLIPYDSRMSAIAKLSTYIPSLIFMSLFVGRSIYMIFKFRAAEPLTKYWCYVVPAAFLTFHTMLATLVLNYLKKTRFFQNIIPNLQSLPGGAVTSPIRPLIGVALFFLLYLYTGIGLCFENLVNYAPDERYDEFKKVLAYINIFKPIPENVTLAEVINVDKNMSHLYRQIMFGGQKVFLFDCFIIISGAYVSSVTMIIVALSIEALANSYKKFNKEIENQIRTAKLQNSIRLMEEIEASIIDYMRLADIIYKCFGAAISMTFMNGLIVHTTAQFALRAYHDNMNLIQMAIFAGWALLGFITTAAPLNRHRTFYKETWETKNMLWQEKTFFVRENEQFWPVLERIKARIDEPAYSRHLILSIKVTLLPVKAILLVIIFAVSLIMAFWRRGLI